VGGIISQATLDQIRAANDIVEVIGASLPLKRAGANFVTLCPFHKEKTPSFHVNPHKQTFHCYGCHKGGNVFSFIMEYESLGFVEAVERLADRARIPLVRDNNPEAQQARSLKDTLLQIHEQITQRWQQALKNDANGQIARDYLKKRGVTDEAVQIFRIGYAPDAWDDTVNWATSKKFDLALVEKAGLILPRDSGGYYDRFRGRLMFPICDEQGRVIAFSGRMLVGDEKTAKYVNSPETPIFSKGRVFFGLDKTKRAILDAGRAIICEGQLDLIACYMADVRNIVAPQGTAFTPEHARILKRYVDEVILCFDSDTAGQKAAARVQESLLASGLAIRVATIPAPHDPDSYIKENGADAFKALIANAQEFLDFYLNYLCASNNPATEQGQLAIVQGMAEMVNKTANQILADKYVQKTAIKLSSFTQVPISPDSVRAEFKKGARAPSREGERSREPIPAEAARPSERESWLLRYLLASDEMVPWALTALDLNWITHPLVHQAVSLRFAAEKENTWHGVPGLLDACEDAALRSLITEAVTEDYTSGDLPRKTRETVALLRADSIDRELQRLNLRLQQPGLPQGEIISILETQSKLRKSKHQPLG
jgi:DNA primase